MAKESAEVTLPAISDADLSSLTDFDSALALINEKLGGEIVEADKELGTGFALLKDPSRLLNIPILILRMRENAGDHAKTFVSLELITGKGEKYVINDGSTGIRDQIVAMWEAKPELRDRPILCRGGLTVSNYYYNEVTGEISKTPKDGYAPASTYYLNTSAVA